MCQLDNLLVLMLLRGSTCRVDKVPNYQQIQLNRMGSVFLIQADRKSQLHTCSQQAVIITMLQLKQLHQ